MHLATVLKDGLKKLAIKQDDDHFLIEDIVPDVPSTMVELLARGKDYIPFLESALSSAKQLSPLDINTLTFLPPVSPEKMIGVGLNYKSHASEVQFDVPTYPVLFARYPSSIVGHHAPIICPSVSTKTDYEGELAVVIGKEARHVNAQEAHAYIAGFTIFNDVTVRDFQGKSSQWLIGKNFDKSGSMGPYIVTQDALSSVGDDLTIITRLDGKEVQHASTSEMIFNIPTLIATITEAITLMPGDVIITGTPEGVGYRQNPPRYLKAHDTLEVEIPGIGYLRNDVISA